MSALDESKSARHTAIVRMIEEHLPQEVARDLMAARQRLVFAAAFGAHIAVPGGVAARVALLVLPVVEARDNTDSVQVLPLDARYYLPRHPKMSIVVRAMGQVFAWGAHQEPEPGEE